MDLTALVPHIESLLQRLRLEPTPDATSTVHGWLAEHGTTSTAATTEQSGASGAPMTAVEAEAAANAAAAGHPPAAEDGAAPDNVVPIADAPPPADLGSVDALLDQLGLPPGAAPDDELSQVRDHFRATIEAWVAERGQQQADAHTPETTTGTPPGP